MHEMMNLLQLVCGIVLLIKKLLIYALLFITCWSILKDDIFKLYHSSQGCVGLPQAI